MPFGLLTESCFSRRIKTAEVFILYYITSPVGCQAEFRVTADFYVKKNRFFSVFFVGKFFIGCSFEKPRI